MRVRAHLAYQGKMNSQIKKKEDCKLRSFGKTPLHLKIRSKN